MILNGPNDWDEWIEITKTKAIANKILEYVNHSTAKEDLPSLTESSIPKEVDGNPEKQTIAALDEAEKEELKLLRLDYKR